jgi:mannitol-1-/sugar-/sorbitol-6-phosphatase
MTLASVGAVLLDMDGTLVSSDAAVERAWTRWAEEYGVPMVVLRPRLHGSPAALTVRAVLPGADADTVRRATQRQLDLQYDDLADVRPAPGARELVSALVAMNLPWAVVTSADRRLASARLGAAGIAAPLLVTSEDTAEGKPSPQPFLAAARRLGIDPSRCLVVEDSAPGVAAGRAAGATVAALRGLEADIALGSLDELAGALLRA